MSESFHANFNFSGQVVLQKNILECFPYTLKLFPYYGLTRPPGPIVFTNFDLLIVRLYVPLKNFSLIWRRHQCRLRTEKSRPMLSAQGFWARRVLCCVTPAVTRDLGFSGLIPRTAPCSPLLRQTKGCGGSILTPILKGFEFVLCHKAFM
jgi:hypothetical protein